jgi:transmembrane sensor
LFDDLPLALATQEVNRYARHKIVLDAGAVNAVRVSGAFESSDTEAFVAAVSKLYDLTARQAPDGSIVLSAPSEKPSA